MQDRSVYKKKRNRNRSKRRQIFCPKHNVLMDSVSQKYSLYADKEHQLRSRGVGRKMAMLLVANSKTVSISGEWLEEFWCAECQERHWYHVRKSGNIYSTCLAPKSLWEQVAGVINAQGNPTVSQFTRRQSRAQYNKQLKDFGLVLGQ